LEGITYAELASNVREKGIDLIVIIENIDAVCLDFRDSIKSDDFEIFTTEFENIPLPSVILS
jgi:hypothetical protein